MIPTAVIQKALDGGYLHDTGVKIANNQHDYVEFEGPMGFSKVTHSTLSLSSSFWQALGKALGWNTIADYEREIKISPYTTPEWMQNAHRFYNLILTGQPTEEFWAELLPKP